MTDEKLFDGCPYTGKTCFNAWDCANCEVEAEERRCMEELEEEECGSDCEHCEWATCPKMEVDHE